MAIISKSTLSEIYNKKYFEEGKDKIVIKETNLSNPNEDVKEIVLSGVDGEYLFINPEWLKDSAQPYNSLWKGMNLFRRDCDAIILLHHNNNHYMLWVELKSGYSAVVKEAMFQIIGSYMRSKSYLNVFPDFSNVKYKELAVVVGHGETSNDNDDNVNTEVWANKKNQMEVKSVKDDLIIKYRRKLKANNGITSISGHDFGMEKMPLSASVKVDELPLIHIVVEGQYDTININEIIERCNL